MRPCIKLWIFFVVLSLLRAARAEPADDPAAAFRVHYGNAVNLFGADRYQEAIKEFQAAYVLESRPRLLFNIGQAHRILGNYKEALRYYLMYQTLEPNPKPGLRDELERYIARMRELIGAAEDLQKAHDHDHRIIEEPRPSPKEKPLYKRGWFWAVVGSGVGAALVIGLAAGLAGGHSSPEIVIQGR